MWVGAAVSACVDATVCVIIHCVCGWVQLWVHLGLCKDIGREKRNGGTDDISLAIVPHKQHRGRTSGDYQTFLSGVYGVLWYVIVWYSVVMDHNHKLWYGMV